jgi:hypothetical protein
LTRGKKFSLFFAKEAFTLKKDIIMNEELTEKRQRLKDLLLQKSYRAKLNCHPDWNLIFILTANKPPLMQKGHIFAANSCMK